MQFAAAQRYRSDIEARFRADLVQFPEISSRTVVDARGDTLYRVGGTSSHTRNFADREWFRVLRDEMRHNMVISDVMISRGTGQPIIVLARAIRDHDGRFLGAANAAVNLESFGRMLESLDVGPHGVIVVRNIKLDKIALRFPPDTSGAGATAKFSGAARIAAGEKSGRLFSISPIDGVERALAFRTLDDFPFSIVVGLAKKDYLYAWQRTAEIFGVLGCSLLAFMIALLVQRVQNESRLVALAGRLSQSESELHDVIESTSDGMLVEDLDGRVLTINQRFVSMWRVPPRLAATFDRNALMEHMATQLEIAAALPITLRSAELRDNASFPPLDLCDGRRIELCVSALRRGGIQAGRVWSFHDVTERKRTERMHQSIIESAADAFVAFDSDLRITAWSARAQSVFGFQSADVMGRLLTDTVLPEANLADGVVQQMLANVRSGVAHDEHRVRRVQAHRQDRSVIPAEVQVSGFKMGEQWLYTCFIRDISLRLAAEQQLIQTQKLDAIGQLTGGLAHDFNNILNIVMGSLDLLEIERDDNRELRDAALSASRRGSEITRSLLAVARRTTLAPRDIGIEESLAEMAPLLRQVAGKQITIALDVCCLRAVIHVDSGAFSNVMLNLVINARDAMPDGGALTVRAIESEMRSDDDAQPRRCIAIDVTDTGGGMTADIAARAFDPFFTTKSRGHGTGLGLAMVYAFARQSGGDAKIISAPGTGTTVRLLLPASANLASAATEPPIADARGHGERILLVDDEPDLANVARHWLASLGYRVMVETDPQRALQRLQSQMFDALVSDVVMPGAIDGVLLGERAIACRPGIAVVLVSGNAGARVSNARYPFQFLDKPYTGQALSIALRNALADKPATATYAEKSAA
jgi:PAS domain S-box-containing protein